MMDTHGSLFPWAHILLICKDDKCLTLSHHCSSFELLFVSSLKNKKKMFFFICSQTMMAVCQKESLEMLLVSVFLCLFSHFSEVSGSQINKHFDVVKNAEDPREVSHLLFLLKLSILSATSSDVWLAGLLRRSILVCIHFLGKEQIKHFARLASSGTLSSINKHLRACKHRSCKILPDIAWNIPFNLSCPPQNMK